MRLKAIFSLTLLVIVVLANWSCTDEENIINFKSAFRNESGEQLVIIGYNTNDQIEYTYNLEDNKVSSFCEIPSSVFLGADCAADSIVVRFQDNKGYICSTRFNNSDNFCFSNDKSPFGKGSKATYYRETAANTFEFIITESDFENAFDLP